MVVLVVLQGVVGDVSLKLGILGSDAVRLMLLLIGLWLWLM